MGGKFDAFLNVFVFWVFSGEIWDSGGGYPQGDS